MHYIIDCNHGTFFENWKGIDIYIDLSGQFYSNKSKYRSYVLSDVRYWALNSHFWD